MKIKTSELTGTTLDWAVAKCEGWIDECNSWMYQVGVEDVRDGSYHPSTRWSQGGPIIERESIAITPCEDMEIWAADMQFRQGVETQYGPTPLVAAMRCYCCAKLGEYVDVPEELCQQ